ncbi:ATP-grasp domain-containing protein [Crocinitomix algicola]|uniref:ATP-grasp domain-containing protein n=1 Tax=Crocinitomix algicola TaxID=1740263 RepID=UPI000830985F|nr:ATP-grasp domain-containing protein [Crocinitomix algicola]
MKKKQVLIINCGWEQETLIRRCAEKFSVIGIHHNDDYVLKNKIEKVYIGDLRDLKFIEAVYNRHNFTAVLSNQCDYSLFSQSYLCTKYNLPGPNLKAAQLSNSKYLQRKVGAQKGINAPDYKLVWSLEEARRAIKKIGLPAIIKPNDNRGSFGVSKIETQNELKEAYFHALQNSISRGVIIESYIKGLHVAVDGYYFKGEYKSLALGWRHMDTNKEQVAVRMTYGVGDTAIENKIMKIHEKVCSEFNYDFGFNHGEYIVDNKGGVYLVENTNRGGGVYLSEIVVPAVSGIDHVGNLINDATSNLKINTPKKIARKPVSVSFIKFNPGKIKAIGYPKEKDDRIIKEKLFRKVNDTIKPIHSGADRDGIIIISGTEDVDHLTQNYQNSVELQYTSVKSN